MAGDLDQVGVRLRQARRDRGWTLEELAARASISASTLSRLESGKRQAALELLVPLTRQLGIRLDDLVGGETPDPRVRRAPVRRRGLVIAPLTLEGSAIRTFKITYPPSSPLPELRTHDGFEWLYVLSGRLRLVLGERDLTLGPGEAAEFDTRVPHAMAAAGARAAEVISIFNEAGARMHVHATDADADDREVGHDRGARGRR